MHNAMKGKKEEEESRGPKKGRNEGQIKEWLSQLYQSFSSCSVLHYTFNIFQGYTNVRLL
jgi:hypothetical protein